MPVLLPDCLKVWVPVEGVGSPTLPLATPGLAPMSSEPPPPAMPRHVQPFCIVAAVAPIFSSEAKVTDVSPFSARS